MEIDFIHHQTIFLFHNLQHALWLTPLCKNVAQKYLSHMTNNNISIYFIYNHISLICLNYDYQNGIKFQTGPWHIWIRNTVQTLLFAISHKNDVFAQRHYTRMVICCRHCTQELNLRQRSTLTTKSCLKLFSLYCQLYPANKVSA